MKSTNNKVILFQHIPKTAGTTLASCLTKNYYDKNILETEFKESEIRKRSKYLIDNDQTRRISGIEPSFGNCTESMFLSACENLAKRFELVGITEKFNETLLLLSIKLGWTGETQYLPKLEGDRQ